MRVLTLVCASFALSIAGGCSQTVIVRADPGVNVSVDGQELGEVGDEGVSVEVTRGMGPVPYTVREGANAYEGEIARSEPSWWMLAAGGVLALCTIPSCAIFGALCANPQLFAAPPCFLVISAVGGPGAAFNSLYGLAAQVCLTPGWLTPASTCAGGAIGGSPLALLGVGDIPSDVLLRKPSEGEPVDDAPKTTSAVRY